MKDTPAVFMFVDVILTRGLSCLRSAHQSILTFVNWKPAELACVPVRRGGGRESARVKIASRAALIRSGSSFWGMMLLAGLAMVGMSASLRAAVPPNDKLTGAISFAGKSGKLNVITHDASLEAAEPVLQNLAGGRSVWYRWQAYTSGKMSLALSNAPINSRLAVYVQVSAPIEYGGIRLVPNTFNPNSQNATFDVQAGTTYLVTVVSAFARPGNFWLLWNLNFGPTQGVDLTIDKASVVTTLESRDFGDLACEVLDGCNPPGRSRRVISVAFSFRNAGKEALLLGDLDRNPWVSAHACKPFKRYDGLRRLVLRDANAAVLQTVEPDESYIDDTVRFDPAAFNERVFKQSFQGLQQGWSHSTLSVSPCHFIDVTDLASGRYFLEITMDPFNRIPELDESNNTVVVPVDITTSCEAPPANDARADATVVTTRVASFFGNTECATKEPNERSHVSGSPAGRSVWFRWTADYTGTATVTTEGSSIDTVLDVQGEATSGVNGPVIASNDDISGQNQRSRVQFEAAEGNTYWIAVDGINRGNGAVGGNYFLHLNPNLNDTFQNALLLAGATGETSADTGIAGVQPAEPAHGGSAAAHSVWYSWIAPGIGNAEFNTSGSRYETVLAAYTGDSIDALSVVASSVQAGPAQANRLAFETTAGKRYWIAVDGKAGASGILRLAYVFQGNQPLTLLADRRADNTVALRLSGPAGQTFKVQRATDLGSPTWTTVQTLTLTAEPAAIVDAESENLPRAFYRAISNVAE